MKVLLVYTGLKPGGITASGPYTVKFTTAKPVAELPLLITNKNTFIVQKGSSTNTLRTKGASRPAPSACYLFRRLLPVPCSGACCPLPATVACSLFRLALALALALARSRNDRLPLERSHERRDRPLRRHVEGKRLWHDPRRRECGLASLTSFHFTDDKIVRVEYPEPAAHLVALSGQTP